AMRRALGYQLKRAEKLLAQFLTYLEDRGEERLRTETALAWATLPTGAHRSWWASRLSLVRGFAAHLRALDPATEVPPADLLPWTRSATICAAATGPVRRRAPLRSCSPPRAPGSSTATSSAPSAGWCAVQASSPDRPRAGPGSPTCATASPSAPCWTATAAAAT